MYKVLPAVLIVQRRVCSPLNTLVQKEENAKCGKLWKKKLQTEAFLLRLCAV